MVAIRNPTSLPSIFLPKNILAPHSPSPSPISAASKPTDALSAHSPCPLPGGARGHQTVISRRMLRGAWFCWRFLGRCGARDVHSGPSGSAVRQNHGSAFWSDSCCTGHLPLVGVRWIHGHLSRKSRARLRESLVMVIVALFHSDETKGLSKTFGGLYVMGAPSISGGALQSA